MRTPLRSGLIWTAGFISFPLAGIAGGLVAGRVDSTLAALAGGLATGAVLGAGQTLFSSGRLDPRRWIPATAAGMAAGLAAGATIAGFGTSLGDLALMGAITGVALGAAQAVALPASLVKAGALSRLIWAVAMPLLWALGWTVTTLAGVQVGEQFTIFGAAGAITVSALTGALLHLILTRPSHPTTAEPQLASPSIGERS